MTHELPAADLSARDSYRLMTDLVTPRPIAWVSTVDGEGRRNLAPFSYYQGVCSDPPTIVLGVGWLADGRPKHTLANVLETGELTINHVSEGVQDAMNASSAAYAREVSEWDACGIEAAPAVAVTPARVAAARGGFECRLTHAIPLGETRHGTPSSTLIIAEVVHVWLADGLLERDERGRLLAIDPAKLGAVGRLGGLSYTTTAGHFELPRPTTPSK
ncbi:Flavin reductase like domain protein [Enhygromyxa salina]|uniref:Flavin reductase like domain protein n=1 Tax=Enhygromyxa salina TaxID=215803 RepID=A0A2S9XH77_9BACT|nr:flavin reductase family protein [Enhygromyxa salina]PRP92187.1 Flavin reductase like domain protein [Enhygromyxa salina]